MLPGSGIGIDGVDLVIAPPGNPVIRLDARLLDRIELTGRSPAPALAVAGAAAAGALASALAVIPGGLVACAGLGYLAHDRFGEARRRRNSRELLLALGDLEVALHVVDGPVAARRIAEALAPYTREAPITQPAVYEEARRRLAAGAAVAGARRAAQHALTVGGEEVRVDGDHLHVGRGASFRVEEVREHALRGSNLALPGGRFVQAALGLLVVAADERSRQGEDLAALARRVEAYEAWSGRAPGR